MPIDWSKLPDQAAPSRQNSSSGLRSSIDWSRLPDQEPSQQAPAPRSSGWPATIGDAAGDVLIGAAKGAGQTAVNLGRLVHQIPGFSEGLDYWYEKLGKPGVDSARDFATGPGLSGLITGQQRQTAEQRLSLEPTNTAQRVGMVGEQIAETLLPSGAISRAAQGMNLARRVGLEAVTSAGISAAQGGDPTVAGVMGGAIPVVGRAVRAAAPALKEGALKNVTQALGATKERYKAMSQRLAPEIMRRGIRGSREQMQQQAEEAAEAAGQRIDDAIQAFGSRQVDSKPVIDALESAKDAYRINRSLSVPEAVRQGYVEVVQGGKTVLRKGASVGPNGTINVSVNVEPRAINQLNSLQRVLRELGPEPRVDQLIAVRRTWDKIVDQAGGYAHRAPGAIGIPLKDQSEAYAKREGASAIRKLLDAEVPELTAYNKEYAFWKSLDDVVSQTLKRTQPQGPGLGARVAGAAGQGIGAAMGASGGPTTAGIGAMLGGALNKRLENLLTSSRVRLLSASMKDQLANAIMSHRWQEVARVLGRIEATQGSKVFAQ
jgi:uncharacterized membrane protein